MADDFLKALEKEREKKQDRVHRFDFAECMPSKENLQKQGLQRLSEKGKNDERLIFRFQITQGNLMNAKLTKGNADDRSVVPQMTVNMKGSRG